MAQAILNENGFALSEGNLTVYTYHPETGEYVGEITPFISIGTGIPANSTLTAPPASEEGFVYCWDGKAWNKTEDHRGVTVYDEKDGSPFTVKRLGALPEGYTATVPPSLKPGETLGGFDPDKNEWRITPPTDLWKAQQNLGKYYQNWNQTYPVGNPPPDAVVKKAADLADWIKEVKADDSSASQVSSKSKFLRLNVETATAGEAPLPPCPPLLTDSDFDW